MSLFLPGARGIRLLSTGAYLPERVVDNDEIAARPGAPLSAAEILRLTGMQERRWVSPEQATSDLAIAAGRQALERAAVDRVDRLIVATTSPDYPSPATACIVQHALGLAPCPAFDVAAACAGYLFALDCAARAIASGDDKALVLAADVRSRFVDPLDRATCALYGDGAGAALLAEGPPGEGLLALVLGADGSGAETIHIPAGGSRRPASAETVAAREHYLRMADGPRVFLTAIEGMTDTAERLLAAVDRSLDEIDLVVPHQPNRMILDRLARYMRLPEQKLFINVERTGNMSSASVAVALDEALRSGRVGPGSLVLVLGAGAGYCAGAALFRLPEEKER